MSRTAVIAGVGPGLSDSIAREFAARGWRLGLVARTRSHTTTLAEELPVETVPVRADVTDSEAVEAAFTEITDRLGPVDVLVNHAAAFRPGGVADLSADQFAEMWQTGPQGAFHCVREVLPEMLDREAGTIIFTGANVGVRAQRNAVGFSSAKFGVRGLARGLAKELGPKGIHVAHVVIKGQVDTPRTRAYLDDVDPETLLDPDAIATRYAQLVEEPPRAWTTELTVRTYE